MLMAVVMIVVEMLMVVVMLGVAMMMVVGGDDGELRPFW